MARKEFSLTTGLSAHNAEDEERTLPGPGVGRRSWLD